MQTLLLSSLARISSQHFRIFFYSLIAVFHVVVKVVVVFAPAVALAGVSASVVIVLLDVVSAVVLVDVAVILVASAILSVADTAVIATRANQSKNFPQSYDFSAVKFTRKIFYQFVNFSLKLLIPRCHNVEFL